MYRQVSRRGKGNRTSYPLQSMSLEIHDDACGGREDELRTFIYACASIRARSIDYRTNRYGQMNGHPRATSEHELRHQLCMESESEGVAGEGWRVWDATEHGLVSGKQEYEQGGTTD